MIIVKLQGGIGNQMFQYALGKKLAYENASKLYLDTNHLTNTVDPLFTNRDSQLQYFNLKFINPPNRYLKKAYGDNSLLNTVLTRKLKIINEDLMQFDKNITSLKGNLYLNGYWQSYLYFESISDVIRTEFTLKTPWDKKNTELINLLKETNSISLHIRRGDYVTNPMFSRLIGCCNIEYYQNAYNYIKTTISNLNFFIFSDDLEWAKTNLNFITENKIYIDNNSGPDSYRDIILMSYCKNNIIANSSFSWWGAWLNNNLNKIVIAPKKWFNDESLVNKDLIPETWIRL